MGIESRSWRVLHGDCLVRMADLEAESVDAVVTDPPYELGFMGKAWDRAGVAFDSATWQAVLRVLKPGGHLLAFGGTRTSHRMVCAIEDAGFEIRDCLMWLYGSGFPKSLDVSKSIDKAAGAERQVVGYDASRARPNRLYEGGAIGNIGGTGRISDRTDNGATLTAPATDAARRWQGWGTALKPAYEPIVLARKPLVGTVAQNVQTYGTGAINVDGCRVGVADGHGGGRKMSSSGKTLNAFGAYDEGDGFVASPLGRWPANVIHDGSDEVVGLFPQTTSGKLNQASVKADNRIFGQHDGYSDPKQYEPNSGSAARFFYTAKASRRERGEGNTHPTVKPLALMRYLCRLVTPPDGLVLDPFTGSGTTGIAAVLEGFRFLGIEQDLAHAGLAERRIRDWTTLPLEAVR